METRIQTNSTQPTTTRHSLKAGVAKTNMQSNTAISLVTVSPSPATALTRSSVVLGASSGLVDRVAWRCGISGRSRVQCIGLASLWLDARKPRPRASCDVRLVLTPASDTWAPRVEPAGVRPTPNRHWLADTCLTKIIAHSSDDACSARKYVRNCNII